MGLIRAATETILNTLSNLEFRAGWSESGGYFRRAFLRYMGVSHGREFAFGLDVYIRMRGNLSIGERCALGSFARIWNYAAIKLGDDFISAGGLTMNSATHDPLTLESVGKPITIGNRVWCGQNVTILAGVSVGDDVVIGAGSVVAQDIPSNCIAAGIPARVVKDLVRSKPFINPRFGRKEWV